MGQGGTARVVLGVAVGFAVGAVLAVLVRGRAPLPPTQYLVQKVYRHYLDRSLPLVESEPAGAGFPVRAHADRAAADADRLELEHKAREEVGNPFQNGRGTGRSYPSLADYTGTPTGEFLDWLKAEGLTPPDGQREAWEAFQKTPEARRRFSQESHNAWWSWWEDQSGRWTPEQRQRVWDKLDRVRFYDVVEVPAR